MKRIALKLWVLAVVLLTSYRIQGQVNATYSAVTARKLTAVIAAPKEVSMHESRTFPVMVQVLSSQGERPDSVVLHAGWGKWETSKSDSTELKLRYGYGVALLSIDGSEDPGKTSLPIWITSVKKPNSFIGSQIEVRLRQAQTIEVKGSSLNLAANGKSTGEIKVRVVDQYNKPLGDVPCLLRYEHPDLLGTQVAVAQTDAEGQAIFTIPSSSKQGKVLWQVVTERCSTPQGSISFNIAD